MRICAATNNPGKLEELSRILQSQGHTVLSLAALGVVLDPEETGSTFAENACIKAEAFCRATGLAAVADDSGLAVDALGGEPGVYSARYCGRHGDDEANNDLLLEKLAGLPAGERTAKFISDVCLWLPDGRHLTCEGQCAGSIAFARKAGGHGFGYDPLFVPAAVGLPDGTTRSNTEGRSYAQLAPAEKDAISHRGAALRQLAERLPAFLAAAGAEAQENAPESPKPGEN